MKENLLKINLKVIENIIMKMVIVILDNGKMVQDIEKVFYILKMEEQYIKANFLMIYLKVMENIITEMEIIILDNLKNV
jgi:hypothetical protein